MPGADIEKAVLQQLGAVFRTPSLLAKTYNAVKGHTDKEKTELLNRRDELLAKIEPLRRSILEAAKNASYDELTTLKEEIKKKETELKEVKQYLKILSGGAVSQAEIAEAFNDVETLWSELFPAEKHRLIQLFIEKIVLFNDRMEMEIKTDGVTSLVK